MNIKTICILSILGLLSISSGTIAASLLDEGMQKDRTPHALKTLLDACEKEIWVETDKEDSEGLYYYGKSLLINLMELHKTSDSPVKELIKGVVILDKFGLPSQHTYLILNEYEEKFKTLLNSSDLVVKHLAKIGNTAISNIFARSSRNNGFISTLPAQTKSELSVEMSSENPLIKWLAYRVVAHTAQYANDSKQTIEILTKALENLPEDYHLNVHECLSNVGSWTDATDLPVKENSLKELITKGNPRQKSQAMFELAGIYMNSPKESAFYNPHEALGILESLHDDTTYRDAALLSIADLKLNGPEDLKNSEEGIDILERIRASKDSMRPEAVRGARMHLLRIYASAEDSKTEALQLVTELLTSRLPEHAQQEVNRLREQASR